jgi:hypothetical protein
MPNLYLTYLDEDCGSLVSSLSNRFHSLYPSYQLFWPIPPYTAPTARAVILQQVEAAVVCVGPTWERLADQLAGQRAIQAMQNDLRIMQSLHQPIMGIFYERASAWPAALHFLEGNTILPINHQADVNRIAISLHLKLQQIYR